jgi:hypothetical protein
VMQTDGMRASPRRHNDIPRNRSVASVMADDEPLRCVREPVRARVCVCVCHTRQAADMFRAIPVQLVAGRWSVGGRSRRARRRGRGRC